MDKESCYREKAVTIEIPDNVEIPLNNGETGSFEYITMRKLAAYW